MTQLLLAAALTAAVETLFPRRRIQARRCLPGPVRRRKRRLEPHAEPRPRILPRAALTWLVYPLELAVVAAEYSVYALACGRSRRLFLLTLAANVLSYSLGLLIFGHV